MLSRFTNNGGGDDFGSTAMLVPRRLHVRGQWKRVPVPPWKTRDIGWRYTIDECLEAGSIGLKPVRHARAPVDEIQVVTEGDGDGVSIPPILEPGLAGEPVLADVVNKDDAILVCADNLVPAAAKGHEHKVPAIFLEDGKTECPCRFRQLSFFQRCQWQ
jgi:hypothetical protein